MRAGGVVQAFIADQKVREDVPADQCFGNDPGNIFNLNTTIPNAGRVDDNHRAVFTLIKTTGEVGPRLGAGQPLFFQLGLEGSPEFFGSFRITTSPTVAWFPMITADEKMRFERSHGKISLWNSS